MAGHFSSLVAAERPARERIPVTVLTGFLGSGKTTLLNQLLRSEDLNGTVVIVNEFGSVGIDQDLITQTSTDSVLLSNGCLCCSVRGDLIDALTGLAERTGGTLRQVLIETSGLAAPAPILRVLMGDPVVSRQFVLSGVVCTVDALLGDQTLDRYPESVAQVALADLVLLTKTDLLDRTDAASDLVVRLNKLHAETAQAVGPDERVRAVRALMAGRRGDDPQGPQLSYRAVGDAPAIGVAPGTDHIDGIQSFVLIRDRPLPRAAFDAWLDVVIASRGEDLLRVKGLVQVAEHPDQPLVVHGVQHLFEAPERLARWPTDDRRTRLVFITRGIREETLGDTLDILSRRHGRRTA